MTRVIITTLLLLTSSWTAAAAQSVGGKYTVTGTNLDGSAYEGTVTITPSGSACRIVWETSMTTKGICMLFNKAFSAYYSAGADVGLVVYELQSDGRLKGAWTMTDKKGTGTEILTPIK